MLNKKTRIYVSTSSFYKYNFHETIDLFKKNNIRNLELSANIYNKNQREELLKYKNKNINFIFHNYFLPPKKSFIINLSSNNRFIIQRSLNHIKKLIRLSNIFNLPFVSFHAGFRFDPKLNSIGKVFKKKKLETKEKSMKIFHNSIKDLSKYGKQFNVKLLIENNVITKKNLEVFKENPLLLCCPDSIKNAFENMPKNVGLLLDTGHFKVSSLTLNFDLVKGYNKIKNFVGGYHLNENDGITDTNLPFTNRSWFVQRLKKKLYYYSIEVDKKFINSYQRMINIVQKNI
jgi:sugar phosphate isomerase/epimerase